MNEEYRYLSQGADITEISMMFGRYVTLMDQMQPMAVFQELMAKNHPAVSIDYADIGSYIGSEHVYAFFEHMQSKADSPVGKRGWMDLTDGATPEIIISEDGLTASAVWNLLSPKARQGYDSIKMDYTLLAYWSCGKMHWELIKTDGQWKILNLRYRVFFDTPYHEGWLKQQQCMREPVLWGLAPDKRPRLDYYQPAKRYSYGSQYNWGPYPSEDGSIKYEKG